MWTEVHSLTTVHKSPSYGLILHSSEAWSWPLYLLQAALLLTKAFDTAAFSLWPDGLLK